MTARKDHTSSNQYVATKDHIKQFKAVQDHEKQYKTTKGKSRPQMAVKTLRRIFSP